MKEGKEEKRKKMSQEIYLCEDSDGNNGERPNRAYIASLPPPSTKRHRDKEASSNAAHLRNENGPGNKTVTRSVEFVVDLELADDVEVPPKKSDVVLG
jgi:hypothetical protein